MYLCKKSRIMKEDGVNDNYEITLSEKEWNELLEEIAGKRAEIKEPVFDPRFAERHDLKTPSGGDYSVAYFYDKDGLPCEKKKKYMNIVEYKKRRENKRVLRFSLNSL